MSKQHETLANRIVRLVDQRIEHIFAEIATDGPEYDAVYDRAFTDAQAQGLDYDAAHREAFRIADEWKAAQQEKAV